MAITTLLTADGNGNGSAVDLSGPRKHFTLYIWGTFDDATVKLQVTPDNTNWFDAEDSSVTAARARNVEFSAYSVRGVVSGGGGSVSISMALM